MLFSPTLKVRKRVSTADGRLDRQPSRIGAQDRDQDGNSRSRRSVMNMIRLNDAAKNAARRYWLQNKPDQEKNWVEVEGEINLIIGNGQKVRKREVLKVGRNAAKALRRS